MLYLPIKQTQTTMTIQDIKNLDFYKCSLQDLNKANRALASYLHRLTHTICYANSWKGSDKYREAKRLHVLVSRAKLGMDKNGYYISRNIKLERLPNSESVL